MEYASKVIITEDGLACERSSGLVESVPWDELRAVIIETNDTGPFGTDVFWIFVGDNGGAVVPMGAYGDHLLLQRLQQLEGFDNEAVIAAMQCHEDRRFLCWERAE